MWITTNATATIGIRNTTPRSTKNGNPCEPYEGCQICEDDSGQLEPVMLYGHILTTDIMINDNTPLKIATETACALIQNNKTGQWFIALMGGGMDLSPHIAYAYVLAQKWLPDDMLETLSMSWCKTELDKGQFEKLRAIMEEQTGFTSRRLAEAQKKWKKAPAEEGGMTAIKEKEPTTPQFYTEGPDGMVAYFRSARRTITPKSQRTWTWYITAAYRGRAAGARRYGSWISQNAPTAGTIG